MNNSWSTVLPEKLAGPQLLKKFPEFYRIQKFITVFTTASHMSLSLAISIHPMAPSHFSKIHFNIILPSTPGSSRWSPTFRVPHQNPVCVSSLPPYTLHVLPISVFLIWSPEWYLVRSIRITKSKYSIITDFKRYILITSLLTYAVSYCP